MLSRFLWVMCCLFSKIENLYLLILFIWVLEDFRIWKIYSQYGQLCLYIVDSFPSFGSSTKTRLNFNGFDFGFTEFMHSKYIFLFGATKNSQSIMGWNVSELFIDTVQETKWIYYKYFPLIFSEDKGLENHEIETRK